MFAIESDFTGLSTAEIPVGGAGGGTSLAEQLGGEVVGQQTPPVYVVPVQPVKEAAGTAAATPVPVTVSAGSAGFWGKLKGSLGSAQAAVVAPVQSGLSSAAKAVGASDETAAKIAPWAGPVVVAVLGTVSVTVYALRRRIFSHQVKV